MDRTVSNAASHPIPACAGVGLRFPHHDFVLSRPGAAAWLEVHPENYLGESAAADVLTRVRRDYSLSLHATGLSLGSARGPDRGHLAALAALMRRVEPGLVSDHLSWSGHGAVHLPDLLPLPYTQEALAIFARNIDVAQDALGRALLIENPSAYLAFAHCEMDEGGFLAELVRRTGCGVLLDVNNVAVSAANLGEDGTARLDGLLAALPPGSVGEIHLAGHAVRALAGGGQIRIDDHGAPVCEEVWMLYERALRNTGKVPTLIERDNALPAFTVLAQEAARADRIMAAQVCDAAC